VRYGFVVDQRKCIGCHACTVPCKEENQVPLGAFRTWVKYVERGHYPDTRRYFSVLRCNHCDDAPCVTICPTVALYRRSDGIVDFDGERCIGCKACMQGCPYDALYIDPSTNTAAKCNYCAHRVEVGLEPACVIVCPVQAIIAGDLDDPGAHIARLVATEPVQVRKAEQGTRPKVFYLGADASALTPSMQAPTEHYAFATRPQADIDLVRMVAAVQRLEHGEGALSRPVYDVPHMARPWGWKVSAYLWTKSIASGTLMIAGLAALLGASPSSFLLGVVPPLVALLFLALTTGLLVFDLTVLLEATLLFAEFSGAHANVDVARAARLVTRGALSVRFWGGAVVAGIVAPLVLSAFGTPAILLGSILALGGLWIYEDVWIKAGQSIPLS